MTSSSNRTARAIQKRRLAERGIAACAKDAVRFIESRKWGEAERSLRYAERFESVAQTWLEIERDEEKADAATK